MIVARLLAVCVSLSRHTLEKAWCSSWHDVLQKSLEIEVVQIKVVKILTTFQYGCDVTSCDRKVRCSIEVSDAILRKF